MTTRRSLDSLIDNENRAVFGDYSPEHIAALLEIFGNPHRALSCVHIAGTNGKGSTAHYLHSILTAAGKKTGLYTSPHLETLRERVRIGDAMISEDELDRLSGELFDALESRSGLRPTWFDALTLIAFRYFHEKNVEYAVIETGLGGRLDSTNVIMPLVSIITSVGLDHMAVLGNSITEIAREKSGIIKPGITVVTACRGEALKVVEAAAMERSAPLLIEGRDFSTRDRGTTAAGRRRFDFEIEAPGAAPLIIPDMEIPQTLPVQRTNASLALAAAHLLLSKAVPPPEAVFRKGVGRASIPGRFEKLANAPKVYFDPAHNPDALEGVIDHLRREHPGARISAVLHFMADKDVKAMLGLLQNKLTDSIYYVKIPGVRDYVHETGNEGGAAMKAVESSHALARELAAVGTIDVVLFTGSFRLYGTAKETVRLLRSPGQ